MPEFTYSARNREGVIINDSVISTSREAVGAMLRKEGLLPTEIVEKRRSFMNVNSVKGLFAHVSMLEKLTFIKNLSVTIKAGLPVSKSLSILVKQTLNPYFKTVLGTITRDVETGKTLSESMGAFPSVFSGMTVNMVRVGEQSGDLDKNLEYLAVQISRDYNLVRRTKGAMMYPAVVMFALLVIGYLMLTFVLPKLTSTFKEFDAELPFLTQMIIKTVDIFSHYSILVLIALVGIFVSFWTWHKTENGHAVIHRVNLSMPVIGKIVKKINIARFTIIFSGLLRSGMSIVEALKITGDTMSNVYYQDALRQASEKVKIGVDLVTALEKYPKLFTPMVTQMIQVGEESGTMEKVLAEVASFYEVEIDDTVKNLSSIVEPILIIVIGAVVGVLAVGLILPIYNITQAV